MFSYADFKKISSESLVCTAYEKSLLLRKKNHPSMNYIGINFHNGEIYSIKYYFSFFQQLTEKEIAYFLPTTADFLQYYHLWEPTIKQSIDHSGCTFTLKFINNTEPTFGFHYRLAPSNVSYKLIGLPRTLPFSIAELDRYPGINYEYSKNETNIKRYYYLDKPEHKEYIAARFEKPYAIKSRLCEFTEADDSCKVNIWTPDYTLKNFNRPSYFNKDEDSIIKSIKSDYNLINNSDGFYENKKIIATYFFNTMGNRSGGITEGPENFHLDTLKLFFS